MAYQIKKSPRLEEDLEFLEEDGTVGLRIHVDIVPERIAKDYRRIKLDLIHAQEETKKSNPEAVEMFGAAIVAMCRTLFGEEQAAQMLEYYNGRYTDMIVNLFPFIQDRVEPMLRTAANDRKAFMAQNYRLNRRQKRKMGL